MAERLTFVLDGRDDLSRVLGHAGDSAIRLRDSMRDAADGSNRAILTLTRDADGRLRDLNGRLVSTADAARLMGSQINRTTRPIADWAAVAEDGRKVGEKLRGMLISLAPAAIPVAAAMAPIAVNTAAAGVAVGAFAAALIPQISALVEASEAEKKYEDAVEKSGQFSKQATEAQTEYARAMAKLPPASRSAAAALSVLKDEYKAWSDSLSQDTMAPFTKGLAIAGGLLPKLTPLVRGTSVELDRMMTLLAGGMESPGFDRVVAKFSDFATGALRKVNDGIVNFARKLDAGKVGGNFTEFMDYARANGPLVGETLRSITDALVNILVAGSDVGVGMLQVVNVLARIVDAVPPSALATLFQLAIAIKLVKLAAVGLVAARGAVATFGVSLAAMRAAAAGATGRMTGLAAAFGTLSRGVRLAVAGTGIGLLLIALSELSERSKTASPDVDKLTTSLKGLAETGKFTGELKKSFGDLKGLVDQVNKLGEATRDQEEYVESFGSSGIGVLDDLRRGANDLWQDMTRGEESLSALEGKFSALDEALAGMVGSGHGSQAAQDFAMMSGALSKAGKSTAEISALFPQYREALAAAAAEQRIAAQAMGLFGTQAQGVQAKLDAQKQSTDGLRMSINALNNTVLTMRGGMRGFEAAIDAADKAAKDNGRTLDINTEKGRANSEALDNLAAATMKAAEGARESGASWSTVNGIYDKGRTKLVAAARQMGLTEAQAKRLAAQILRTPDKTARLKGNMEDLQRKLDSAKAQLKRVPDSRKAAVRAQIADLEAKLRSAKAQLASVDGRTAHTYVVTTYIRRAAPGDADANGVPDLLQRRAHGGIVRGPGTGTSDSIPARLSNGEFVVRASQTQRFRPLLEAINRGQASSGYATALPTPPPAMAAPGGGRTVIQHFSININGAVDSMSAGREVERVLSSYKRNKGGGKLGFED